MKLQNVKKGKLPPPPKHNSKTSFLGTKSEISSDLACKN